MFVREIPREHAAKLRWASGLEEGADIPPKLEQKYWELKRCCDRINYFLTDGDMARLAADSGFGKPTRAENAPPTIEELWRRKELKAGDAVEVHWVDGLREAVLLGMRGRDEAKVRFDGDDVETFVSVERVAVPQTAA